MKLRSLLTVTAFALSATIAMAAPGGMEMSGGVLVDVNGMTLYTFDKDEAGKSNCYDKCAVNWPPAAALAGDAAEGDFTLVERNDGSKQWAYKGMPLYLWIKDTKPGDKTGDGVGGVWHVIAE